MRKLSEAELVVLKELYDHFGDKSFSDAMSCFSALADLLRENEAPEIEALKQMTEAAESLEVVRARAASL